MSDPMEDYLKDLERRQQAPAPQGQPAPQGPPPQQLVVPYVEYHTGPRRLLWLTLTGSSGGCPIVGIDGRSYLMVFGVLVPFEIPADRPVHLSIHVEGSERFFGVVSRLLPPGPEPLQMTYATKTLGGASLTP